MKYITGYIYNKIFICGQLFLEYNELCLIFKIFFTIFLSKGSMTFFSDFFVGLLIWVGNK